MFHDKDRANELLHYLSSCHSIEFEQDNVTPSLDILVTSNQKNTFMTSIYQKENFHRSLHEMGFVHSIKYKIDLICSLTFPYYRPCSSGSLLQSALNDLRKLFLQSKRLPYRHQPKNPVFTVPKKISLSYFTSQVCIATKSPNASVKSFVFKFYSCVNLKIIFQNTRCIKSNFPYKDRINRSQQSRVIYKVNCRDCDGFGKTKRRLHDLKTEQ